ncbi:MAG: hypothetical protein H0T88_00115 [Lysobacter sp.]|nr:hypothetical protein [Lysobacter sp.]
MNAAWTHGNRVVLLENGEMLFPRGGRQAGAAEMADQSVAPLRTLWSLVVFHVLRHLPAWVGLWPAHPPRIRLTRPKQDRAR